MNTPAPARPAVHDAAYVRPSCPHRTRTHRWRVTALIPIRLFGVFPPAVRIRCTRCGLTLDADVTRVTEPMIPNKRQRLAAHRAAQPLTTRARLSLFA